MGRPKAGPLEVQVAVEAVLAVMAEGVAAISSTVAMVAVAVAARLAAEMTAVGRAYAVVRDECIARMPGC